MVWPATATISIPYGTYRINATDAVDKKSAEITVEFVELLPIINTTSTANISTTTLTITVNKTSTTTLNLTVTSTSKITTTSVSTYTLTSTTTTTQTSTITLPESTTTKTEIDTFTTTLLSTITNTVQITGYEESNIFSSFSFESEMIAAGIVILGIFIAIIIQRPNKNK